MGPVRSGSCHAVPKCRAPGSDICQLKMGNMSDIPQPGPQENTKKLDIGPWPDPGQRVISLGHTGQDPAPPNPPPPRAWAIRALSMGKLGPIQKESGPQLCYGAPKAPASQGLTPPGREFSGASQGCRALAGHPGWQMLVCQLQWSSVLAQTKP